jgi:hypothetical protein
VQSSQKDSKKDMGLNNLASVQINVTAATPLAEHANRKFQEEEEEETSDDNIVEKQEQEKQENDATHKVTEHASVKRMTEKPPQPPKPQPPQPQVQPVEEHFEANFEAHFEANFDDAFGSADASETNVTFASNDAFAPSRIDDAFSSGSEPEIPKQVVGGRASIPEELEPDQLARLQNLKESNA